MGIKGNLSELKIPPLNEKQGAVLISPASEIMYGGSLGSGKSFLLRVLAILYASLVPGIQVYLLRRLTSDIQKNHMEGNYSLPDLLNPWVQSGYVKINYSAPIKIAFGNGSRIFLDHCQYEKTVYSFQGREMNVILYDEATHFTETQYRYLRTRNRLGSLPIDVAKLTQDFNNIIASWGVDYQFTEKIMSHYFPRIICGTNPGGVGHQFFKEGFVDPAPPMKIWKTEEGTYRQYIPALYTDNPALLENDPDYIKRIGGLGDKEMIQALVDGRWDILSGGAFTSVYDEAVHLIEPFEIPQSWRIDRACDYGSARPTAVVYTAESNGDDAVDANGNVLTFPRGTIFVIDELYIAKKGELNKGLELSSYEIGEMIAQKELSMGIQDRIKAGPADNSIFTPTRMTDRFSSHYDAIKAGYNSVLIKNHLRKRHEIFGESDKTPGSRIRGLEVMRTMFKSALKSPMEDKGLFVFNHCVFFKRTVPMIQRDEKNPEDVDTDSIDHYYDALRYRVATKIVPTRKISNYL